MNVIKSYIVTNAAASQGGGSVESVTGDGVDNTDPENPVLTFPNKSQIGLGNVDNTSDVNKPVSTAQAIANAAVLSSANAYSDALVLGLGIGSNSVAVFYGDFGAMLAPFVNSASGTGATAAISSIAGNTTNPGTAICQTGSTSSGQAYITLSASFNNFLLGGGLWDFECVQYINVLSTGTERFVVIVGFNDSPSTSDATDGCYFRYVDNVNSGNWQAITRSNSVETGTVTDTGVAPVATINQKFRIVVNAAGTQVTYYIDNVQVAQHSANIPTGSGRQSTWCTGIRKTVGNTAMSIVTDYINIINELTTPR